MSMHRTMAGGRRTRRTKVRARAGLAVATLVAAVGIGLAPPAGAIIIVDGTVAVDGTDRSTAPVAGVVVNLSVSGDLSLGGPDTLTGPQPHLDLGDALARQ